MKDPRNRNRFVRLFLDAGCDPNAVDSGSASPLIHAVTLGDIDSACLLLEAVRKFTKQFYFSNLHNAKTFAERAERYAAR